MSGPKKSRWEIDQEIREKRKREQEAKRRAQIEEINQRLNIAQSKLESLSIKYSEVIDNSIKNMILSWIREVDTNGDLRDAFKKLRGIENYLDKQKAILQSKQAKLDAKKEAQRLKEEKINNILASLQELKIDYKDILNEGILQRIELFSNAIKSNPDNQRTLEQIKQFKKQLYKMQEEYQEKKFQTDYVADKFAKLLNSDIKKNGSNLQIKGKIDGVEISVKINYKNSDIDLDTPLDSSCKRGIKALLDGLKKENINLGEIKVLRSGEVLNRQSSKNSTKRIKI